ncbi:calmodulin-binding protein 60 A [Heracleum sosnowskyi]|uniref:Calmodulin-binding protein 60 A n=1 Tax=Heracleum sosnowskyi TaxID=360622 RepID=A0AAD8M227_9APIA|nr:calmodulin-binding protein 60 A [Heracleum sosnowskyi]
MSQKRQKEDDDRPTAEEESFSSSDSKRRKVPCLRNVVLEVMKLQALRQYMEPVLEPLIRRVIKEEVELALQKYTADMKRNSSEEIQPTGARSLKLQFLDTISQPVFTGSHIEAEGGNTMRVAIVDALTGQVVRDGPISSAKVEVVVLEGDFHGNVGDNWTHEEFMNNLVREREGKKALLSGDAVIYLEEGIGLLGVLSFTDNSSWTRSRKFRLGAIVLDNCDGIRVREAKTDSFTVRDHRGELYKKHYPPSLFDEVWRLEKIGKEGAFHKRLCREGINTVKDFLILLNQDPTRLRHILGPGMSTKVWEATLEHARTCVLDERVYVYFPRPHVKNGVVFNVVGQVTGLLRDGQYVLVDELSELEKADAHSLVILAFKKWEEVVALDESSLLSNDYYPSNSSMAGSSNGINILSSNNDGSFEPQFDASTPDLVTSFYSMRSANNTDNFGLHDAESIEVNLEQSLSVPDLVANSFICDSGSITQSLGADDHLHLFDTLGSFQNPSPGIHGANGDLYSLVSEFVHGHSVATDGITKAQRRWRMLFSVLRWFSVRRIVARKSMQQRQAFRTSIADNNFQL